MALASRLAALPTRPPTPPRDLSRDATPSSLLETNSCATQLNTPATPSASRPDYFSRPTSRGTKRKHVNFLLTPTHSDQPSSSPHPPSSPHSRATRVSLHARQSKSRTKPGKSILKATSYGLLADFTLDSDVFNLNFDFALSTSPLSWKSNKRKMLQEVCQQLQGTDKSIRLDAYQSLNKALRQYDDLPDHETLTQAVPVLVDYLQRDLQSRKGDDHRDGYLTLEALKLATFVAWRNPITLKETQRAELLDWCIEVLTDKTSTKMLVNNVLLFIQCQNFEKIMTSTRANKILDILQHIESRVSGTQVRILRLEIYKKFLSQLQPLMVARASNWLRPLFDGLLSDKKDLVQRALTFGRQTAIALGSKKEVSGAIQALLQRPLPPTRQTTIEAKETGSSKPVVFHLFARLNRLIRDKNSADRVPQIWSIVALFQRNRRHTLMNWHFRDKWLRLLQECLNSKDSIVKARANSALVDLIYVLRDEMIRDHQARRVLGQLILAQLGRNEKDKSRKSAEHAYSVLLYYAFRPAMGEESMSWFWRHYVVPLFQLDEQSKNTSLFTQKVLAALFGAFSQQVWDKDRVLRPEMLLPEDIPRLDPTWTRNNATTILQCIQDNLGPAGNRTIILEAWRALNSSVVEAKREVVASSETMNLLAAMLTSVKKQLAALVIERRVPPEDDIALGHVLSLLSITLKSFGRIPANEKALWLDDSGVIQADHSQSKVPRAAQGKTGSAIELAVQAILTNCSSAMSAPASFDELISVVLELAVDASVASKSAQLRTFAELSQYSLGGCQHKVDESTSGCLRAMLWNRTAERTSACMKDYSSQIASPDSQPYGGDFQHVVNVLVNGFQHKELSTEKWDVLFSTLVKEVRQATGTDYEISMVLGVLEPFARGVLAHVKVPLELPGLQTTLCCKMLAYLRWPMSEHNLGSAQQTLWRAAPVSTVGSFSEHYNTIYTLFVALLKAGHVSFIDMIFDVIRSVISHCPAEYFAGFLQHVGIQLGDWLSTYTVPEPEQAFGRLWKLLLGKIDDCTTNTKILPTLEPILLVGLTSIRDDVVSEVVNFWNNHFGQATDLELPGNMYLALERAAQTTTVKLNSETTGSMIVWPTTAPLGHQATKPQNKRFLEDRREASQEAVDRVHITLPELVADNLPSSRPEFQRAEAELPELPTSISVQATERDAFYCAPQRLESSSMPDAPRYAKSDGPTILHLPMTYSGIARADSDPTASYISTTTAKNSKIGNNKQEPSVFQEDLAVFSKHFPIVLSDNESNKQPEQDQSSTVVPYTRMENPKAKASWPLSDCSVESVAAEEPTPVASRKRSANATEAKEPPTKRHGSGHLCNHLQVQVTVERTPSASDLSSHAEASSCQASQAITTQKRRRGRPRKSLAMVVGENSQEASSRVSSSRSEEEADEEDCIIVASSQVFSTSQTQPRSKRMAPSQPQDKSRKRRRSSQRTAPQEEVIQSSLGKLVVAGPLHQSSNNGPQRNKETMKGDVEQSSAEKTSKRRKLSATKHQDVCTEEEERTSSQNSQSGLSVTAQNILSRLKALLKDAKEAVLGRTEVREIRKTLRQLDPALDEAEDRGEVP